MLVKTYAGSVYGVDAKLITIEVSTGGNIMPNQNAYNLVGLPDNAVREGYLRIQAALKNCGFPFPRKRLTINLAPANLKKEGSSFDLPIAMGVLASAEAIRTSPLNEIMLIGELSLDGSVRPVKGVLPIAIKARELGFKGIIVPKANANEAAIVNQLEVYGVENLRQAVQIFDGHINGFRVEHDTRNHFFNQLKKHELDFADVKGQEKIKRAMEIAAAGGHNIILVGPPGAGKTMLAKRLPTILPPLNLLEALETTKIHSVAGSLSASDALIHQRPFRSPHHTVSDVALVGGGSNPHPGEISLAHNGVLFLDELPEFKRTVLEVLRQPMEQRKVTISRARISVDYPASFMLVASMNPCPCGYYNHPTKECVCAPGIVQRYLNKISGPLLDRIDLHVEVTPVSYDELITMKKPKENSEQIRERVIKARARQQERFIASNLYCNAQMPGHIVRKTCQLSSDSNDLLKKAMEKLQMSARAYDRIIKVARTIADLEDNEDIKSYHIAEAIQYRNLDRSSWAG